ncbi:MAG: hypothetical protein RG741_04445 [Bacteroidales bacterium]|nr:hypothetical protein [Bacteroidales bacterium]
MNKKLTGRPVDLSGINMPELYDWIHTNKQAKKTLICQAIIALYEQATMTEVCKVMNISREGVRLWKNQLRLHGLKGLGQGKAGKRSRLTPQRKTTLRKIIRKKPAAQGYDNKKWTGLIIQDFVKRQWNIDISLRTAQLWLSKNR